MIRNVESQIQEWLTVAEFVAMAPEKLELSESKVGRWCREKVMPATDVRREGAGKADWRISVKDAETVIRKLLSGLPINA